MTEPMGQQYLTSVEILMPTETREEKIDFVIERQKGFPSSYYLSKLTDRECEDMLTEWDKEDRNVLCSKLEALTKEEFAQIYNQERRELQREVELYLKPADAFLLERWLVMEAWSLAEALFLWLGSIPRPGVDLGAWAKRNRRLTSAAVEVAEHWNLIERALWIGVLREPVDPKTFMQWAVKTKRASPEVFTASVVDEKTPVSPVSNGRELKTEIARLKKQNDRLSSRLAELDQPHYRLSVNLFGALCVGIYGFDIESERNDATRIITRVISEHWNGRCQKQVLDYIRSAVLALPQGGKKYANLKLESVPTDGKSDTPNHDFP